MANKTPFKLGIIGAGVMGLNHLKVAASSPNVIIVGLYDIDKKRAAELAVEYNIKSYDDIKSLTKDADGITVAAPSFLHYDIGKKIISEGCHLLIEKPIALNAVDAEKLTLLAADNNVTLLAGHIEQFNPTFRVLKELISDDEIFDGHFSRLATQAGRDKSATIVFDLMIHDLELGISLGGNVKEITASGHKVKHGFIDHASAALSFENGTVFKFTASAVSQMRDRTVTLFGKKHTYTADLGNFTITVYTKDEEPKIIEVERQNALLGEIEYFVSCAKDDTDVTRSVNNAVNAIKSAVKIEEIIENGVNKT